MNNISIGPKDEPSTTAKLIIITTNGQLQIQLWAKQTPLACRNFIQLALQGYYDNTIFHRLIPNFMIQGGDPTGTGTGGQSIYGQPFKDQFHQRLKFGRRGIVAMANSDKDSNNSQFFITFAECQHLNKKHTIFGKVVGDSIYNLLAFQSLDTDSDDRPTYPPSIKKIKVILNPFDDIIPRNIHKKQQKKQNNIQKQQQQKQMKKSEIKKLKNKKKLTFQQQQIQHDQTTYKIKSSHDTLNDQKLSKKVAITQQQLQRKRKQKQEENQKKKQLAKKINQVHKEHDQNQDMQQILKAQLMKKKRNIQDGAYPEIKDDVLNYQKKINPITGKVEIVWTDEVQQIQKNKQEDGQQNKMNELRSLQQRQYEALRADQLNFKKLKQGSAKQRRKQLVVQQKTLLSNVQKRKYEFLKKSMIEKRQGEVLSKLNKFTQRLTADNPTDWMCHKLKFHIDSQNAYNLDKKNQQRKGRNQDQDDGGLKVQYQKYNPQNDQINVQQLYQLTAKDDVDIDKINNE